MMFLRLFLSHLLALFLTAGLWKGAESQVTLVPSWSAWGAWNECSATCGKGIHYRMRSCMNGVCDGSPLQLNICQRQPCPVIVSECVEGSHPCEEIKQCIMTDQGPICSCNNGLSGMGKPCMAFHGCFQVDPGASISSYTQGIDPASCYQFCVNSSQFTYAIINQTNKGNTQCFCADSFNETEVSLGNCKTCPMNEYQTCGAANYWSVYVKGMATDMKVTIDLCYNETDVTRQSQCREDRIKVLIAAGVAKENATAGSGFFYPMVEFNSPCDDQDTGCFNSMGFQADCIFNPSTGERNCSCPQEDVRFIDTADASVVRGTMCSDINECSNASSCNPGSVCKNTFGGFSCICASGYRDNNRSSPGSDCRRLDNECLYTVEPLCGRNARCINTSTPVNNRFHICVCNTGYTGNGTTCNDIDECVTMPGICGSNAECDNSMGSYFCTCNMGFIQLTNGSCQQVMSSNVMGCPANPSSRDRQIAFSQDCSVALLFPCNASSLNRGQMQTVETLGSFTTCANGMIVSTFDAAMLNNPNSFSDGGAAMLEASVDCDAMELAVSFNRAPVEGLGFNLDNLFLGGLGDFSTAQSTFGSVGSCLGSPSVMMGLQYRFALTDFAQCGTMSEHSGSTITYTNAVRGRVGISGQMISTQEDFMLQFSCSFSTNGMALSGNSFVFDFSRRKRDVSVSASIFHPLGDHKVEMSLWQDGGFRVPYDRSKVLDGSGNLFLRMQSPNLNTKKFELNILRCYQTPTADGRGKRYKNIIANACSSNEWDAPSKSDQKSSVHFAFQVASFQGGVIEDVYVSCLIDVLDKPKFGTFRERCAWITQEKDSIRADMNMKLLTVGPISVRDVCGGKARAGCGHYCSISQDKKAQCYCMKGFEIDKNDAKKCIVSDSGITSGTGQVSWYYYVAPILVLVFLLILIVVVVVKVRKSSSHRGSYKLTGDHEPSDSA